MTRSAIPEHSVGRHTMRRLVATMGRSPPLFASVGSAAMQPGRSVATPPSGASRAVSSESEPLAVVDVLRRVARRIARLRATPALVLISRSTNRSVIERDVQRWVEVLDIPQAWSFDRQVTHLLTRYPEFRNLLRFRLDDGGLLRLLTFRLWRPVETLILDIGELGPGLFIQHGFATIVSAKRIGADCWINQQVTVGHVYDRGSPVIGDRVTIAAGAVVIGPIVVGDDVTIGANTTVVKDVPAGSVVVGQPNRVIPRGGTAGGDVDPRARTVAGDDDGLRSGDVACGAELRTCTMAGDDIDLRIHRVDGDDNDPRPTPGAAAR